VIPNTKITKFENNRLMEGTGNDNIFQNGEFFILKNALNKRDVVFDVGANKGNWTKVALSIAVLDKVFCFEPIKEMCDYMQSQFFFRENLTIYNRIISDKDGIGDFFIYRNNHHVAEMSNMFGRPKVESQMQLAVQKLPIPMESIDSICKNHGIDRINFLKIDTEGAEELVLRGASGMLGKHAIDYIQFEYGGCFVDSGARLKNIFEILNKNNYAIFRILPDSLMGFPEFLDQWHNQLENFAHCNYLAILNDKNEHAVFKSKPKQTKKRKRHKAKPKPEINYIRFPKKAAKVKAKNKIKLLDK